MNKTLAQATEESCDFRVLNEDELDHVNGGFLWFIAAGAYLLFVGGVGGYYGTKAIID